MSNIKTFSSYNQEQRANQYAVGGSSGNLNSSGIAQDNPYQPSTSSSSNGVKTCFQIIFPKFSWKTFNFAIMIIDIIIFFVTIIVDSRLVPDNSFSCVLYRFGAKYTPAITVYDHIHRLILPIILHGGFAHLFFNMLSQAMYGFLLEDFYGHVKFIVLYIASGIGGNLLSAAVNKTSPSVGASSALFGLFALQLSYILQNYDRFGPRRNLVLGLAIFNIVANLGTIADSSTIDGMAHLGGFIVGGLIAIIYYQRPTDKHFRIKKIVAGVLLLVYFLATFISVMTFKGLENDAYLLTTYCDYVFDNPK